MIVTVSSGATGTSYTIVNPTIDSLWANSTLQGKAKIRQFIRDVARLNDFNADEFLFTAIGESGLSTKSKGDWNPKLGKYTSLGLWQINDVHKISDACRFDPVCSTKFAVKLWKETPLHWTCYKELVGILPSNNCRYKSIEIKGVELASDIK